MKRRNFIKGLLGLAAVPVIAKAGIGGGSSDVSEEAKSWIVFGGDLAVNKVIIKGTDYAPELNEEDRAKLISYINRQYYQHYQF